MPHLLVALKKAGMLRPKIVVVTLRLVTTIGGEEEAAQSPLTRRISRSMQESKWRWVP